MKGNMGPDASLMNVYGLYLAHGGTPDGFMEMTMDDIQLMYTSFTAMNKNNSKDIVIGVAKIMGKVFGDENE